MRLRVVWDPDKFKLFVVHHETGELVQGVRGIRFESEKAGELPTLTIELIKNYVIDANVEWPRNPEPKLMS